MKAFYITKAGKVTDTDVSRKDLTKKFNIHNRDLRPIFLSQQVSTILIRGDSIIINLGSIKIIVGQKDAYIFNVSNKNVSENLVPKIYKELTSAEESSITFEFKILDLSLSNKQEKLFSESNLLEKKVNKILQTLRDDSSEENLEILLTTKKDLASFESDTHEIQRSILDILEDEEDVQDIYLAKEKSSPEEIEKNIEEIESILENYIEQIEEIIHKTSQLKEHIDSTQDIITLKLANVRNTIIRFDLIISIVTAVLAVPTIIVGLYGMNIISSLEKSNSAFFIISSSLIVFLLFMFFFSWWYLRRKKII